MKRSEMIDKLSSVLLQFMPTVEPRLRNLIADVVLTEAEREGMTPPERVNPNYPGGFAAQYDGIPYKIQSWEKENEAKVGET
jgi:hypothetical protein